MCGASLDGTKSKAPNPILGLCFSPFLHVTSDDDRQDPNTHHKHTTNTTTMVVATQGVGGLVHTFSEALLAGLL
jgi:hypothetical protein